MHFLQKQSHYFWNAPRSYQNTFVVPISLELVKFQWTGTGKFYKQILITSKLQTKYDENCNFN